MKIISYKNVVKFPIINAIFGGVLGILLFAVPKSVLDSAFYVTAIYMALFGVLRFADALFGKAKNEPMWVLRAITGSLLMAFGVVSLGYMRYVVHITPLYISAVLMAANMLNFVLALCAPRGGMKWLLIAVSILSGIVSVVAIVFTFGFGVNGVTGLANAAGISAILFGGYALITHLHIKRSSGQDEESEDGK